MLIFFVGLIFAIYAVYRMTTPFYEIFDYIFFVLFSILFSLPVLALCVGIACLIGLAFDQTNKLQETHYLASFRDVIGINGRFFLGTGKISNNFKYYFYKKVSNNGYKADSIDSDNAIVYQDETNQPYISIYVSEFKNKWAYIIALPSITASYAIHIPPDSIVKNYQLSLGGLNES